MKENKAAAEKDALTANLARKPSVSNPTAAVESPQKPGRADAERKVERPSQAPPDGRGEAARLVAGGWHEEAVHAIARLLSLQGSRLPLSETRAQVAQQRTSALACIRRGASHSLALSLPAALAQGRGKRLDVEDQVGQIEKAIYIKVSLLQKSNLNRLELIRPSHAWLS